MKIKCDFCENHFEDTESCCPYCGGVNAAAGNRRFSNGVPKTVAELRQWAQQNHVPLDKMRVYIGENNRGPKCIGIYKDGDEVTVYKNKCDGTRAVRYQGTDEAYAVNEVYLKIKEMLAMADAEKRVPGSNGGNRSDSGYAGSQSSYDNNGYHRRNNNTGAGAKIIGMVILIVVIAIGVSMPSCSGNISRLAQGYSSGYYSGSYGSGHDSNSSGWDWDYDDSDDDYDWDSDWDSDYGDYDWDFDYDWDSDW